MRRKEVDGQEAVMWLLGAILSVGITVTFITQDQEARKPGCIRASELIRGAIVIDVERQNNVCQD